jgi:hypothetical protein
MPGVGVAPLTGAARVTAGSPAGPIRRISAHGRGPVPKMLLFLLLGGDVAFIGIHVLYKTSVLADPLYALDMDRGYAELFQYIKEYWIILLLLVLGALRRSMTYPALAAVFAVLLVDDCFHLHETHGFRLARLLPADLPGGVPPGAIGELLVLAALGLPIVALVAVSYFRADARDRRFMATIVGLGALLVFFGVGVDLAASLVHGTRAEPVLNTVEDGGEMVVMSVIVWTVFQTTVADWARRRAPTPGPNPAAHT